MDGSMLRPLLLMIVAFYCLFASSLLLYMRSEILRRESATNWVRKLVLDKAGQGATHAV